MKRGFLILLAFCPCALALNPSLDISQYAHTSWRSRDGTFPGIVNSIAQTPDGYLWFGTDFGLLRFDGVRFVAWQPPAGQQLPDSVIYSLFVSRDGRFWIGTKKGLASWKEGKLSSYVELAGYRVHSLMEDLEGTVWAGTQGQPGGKLCEIRTGGVQCYGQNGSLGPGVFSLHKSSGRLWAGVVTGFWEWTPGPPRFYPAPETTDLTSDHDGRLLIATSSGIRQLVNGKVEPYPIPNAAQQFRPVRLLSDRDGGLWIGTSNRGLLHLRQGRTDRFSQSDGLPSDYVMRLFEDREGDIWVSTPDGLDRFRDYTIPTVSANQGFSGYVTSVLASSDGSVRIGTVDGLDTWRNGQVAVLRRGPRWRDAGIQSLFQDDRGQIWAPTRSGISRFQEGRFLPVTEVPGGFVWSIAGTAENLWLSVVYQGLLHLREGRLVERIPWTRLRRSDWATVLVQDPSEGGLWLGFPETGLAYFKDGEIRASYTVADGLGQGWVKHLRLDKDGALWASTEGGLSRVRNGRIATLTTRNGLSCDSVHWTMEDDLHVLWLYTACGLMRIPGADLGAWVANPQRKVRAEVFDASDGVELHASPPVGYSPQVAKAADGRLWFVSGSGVSILDPRYLPVNKIPPPVHIEQITADRKLRWQNLWGAAGANLRLPALSRDLEIDYTALSMVAPEKVRFRCKLEGKDNDWQDVGTRRQAFYNDLPPRHYRFRVKACNNSGLWNEAGDSLEFSIDPAYYQTKWFMAACGAAFLTLLWGLYWYRLHQIAREFNARLEERVGERTRIARELHDTLLQSFQGLMLRFQIALNLLPTSPAKAAQELEKALERADQAIAEGRDSIHDLRSSTLLTNDLSQAVQALGDELASQDSPLSASFRVVVEGAPRELHPILRDEIYRIAREAVRNAFRHAQALHIEAEISYGERALRLRVRDDGRGIDPAVVEEGRAGHYGLPGMRERAKRIGAELNVWSGVGSGTEMELSVPGTIAYGRGPARGWWWRRQKHEKS